MALGVLLLQDGSTFLSSLCSIEVLVVLVVLFIIAMMLYAFMGEQVVDLTTLARGFKGTPEEMQDRLSEEAKSFIQDKLDELKKSQNEGVGDGRMYDSHAHIVGIGAGGTGCYFSTHRASLLQPAKKIKYWGFVCAAGLSYRFHKRKWTDRDYVDRLAKLVRTHPEMWGKIYLLGMDKVYDEVTGKPDDKHTGLYVPNEFVFEVCETYPDIFMPAVSINPYRKDAIEELEKCAKRGAKLIKWLPNSMGFNPGSAKCDPFYDKVKELGMVLLSHTGREHTIDGGKTNQSFGNPLHLKRPLNKGIQVIAAHCSTKGSSEDFENGNKETPCIDLFLRMMEDPKYDGLLFADISALSSAQRVEPLKVILQRKDIHHRLVNGSDYPLPAVNMIIHTHKLQRHGLITKQERKILNEIYNYNPLLFDALLKRTVNHKGNKFPVSVFTRNNALRIYPNEK